jgi:hypothetical protein
VLDTVLFRVITLLSVCMDVKHGSNNKGRAWNEGVCRQISRRDLGHRREEQHEEGECTFLFLMEYERQ